MVPPIPQPVLTGLAAVAATWLAVWGVTWPPKLPAAPVPASPQAASSLPAAQDAYPIYRKVAEALDTPAIYQANKAYEAYRQAPGGPLPGECANQAAANRLRLLALADGRGRAGVQLPLEPGAPLPVYLYSALGQVATMACARDLQVGHPEKAARTAEALLDMTCKFARARGAGGRVYQAFGGCGTQVLNGLLTFRTPLLSAPTPVLAQLGQELDRAIRLAPPVEAIPRGELTALVATWQDGPYLTTPLYRFREHYGQSKVTRSWKYPETGGISTVPAVAAAVPLMEAALKAGDLQKLRRIGEPPGGEDFLRGTSATLVFHPGEYARWVALQQTVDAVGRGAQTWIGYTHALVLVKQMVAAELARR